MKIKVEINEKEAEIELLDRTEDILNQDILPLLKQQLMQNRQANIDVENEAEVIANMIKGLLADVVKQNMKV